MPKYISTKHAKLLAIPDRIGAHVGHGYQPLERLQRSSKLFFNYQSKVGYKITSYLFCITIQKHVRVVVNISSRNAHVACSFLHQFTVQEFPLDVDDF